MNNNEIKNPKTEVPTGIILNDKDYANNLLSSLKELIKNYSLSLTEASNKSLFQEYKSMFDEYSNLQREIFEIMFQNGWYTLEKAELQKINNKYEILNKELMDLKG